MRFIVTAEGENLTALAHRLFRVESKEAVARARRRLLELNPDLPDRKNIAAGTIVFVPEDLDGEPPREGRALRDLTEALLPRVEELAGRLDETLSRLVSDESARHAEEQRILGEPQLRRAARESPELAARLTRLGEAVSQRQQRTKELERLAQTATREIREDLTTLAKLSGDVLPD